MLGETGRQKVIPICGTGDFLAYGSPRITAAMVSRIEDFSQAVLILVYSLAKTVLS
jgi:hypothetical protein